MITSLLLADLVTELPHPVRLQRLVNAIRTHFGCGAVGLLKIEGDGLRPLAVDGLVRETLGRRFVVAQHPRLSAILASRAPVRFPPGSPLPDPYDGLLENHRDEPLPVHDCMGVSLHLDGQPWGVLTLDAPDSDEGNGEVFDTPARDALAELALLVETSVRMTRIEEENRALRAGRSAETGRSPADGAAGEPEIVGQSGALLDLLKELDVVADSELPVLLLGETGVGKELFAHRLHRMSRRAAGPLIHVNCAALPESLSESELFGHVRGAFSGALADRAGRIEAAQGGTLFLDEVGELPLAVQAKLLRTLQNGEIQRLGADQVLKVDVRIVAATNRQLPERVREGHFRADLYHRLSVYPVRIPPLRERGNDVLLLAGRFLEINRTRLGLRGLRLSPRAETALCAYAWPGNVRELEHVIGRAALRAISHGAGRGEIVTLEPAHLDLDLSPDGHVPPADFAAAADRAEDQAGEAADLPLKPALEAYQRQLIRQALARCGDNWASAARVLGLDASNLHKLARRLGMKA
jgi:anaerobic nitric oxide reductase transcription regulator